ncbi:hypothetical protein M7I_6819 [Glarea lozoyensis 74030]|uniref:Uncharacterized protein n=1 Tax=Glarea lozoyensis (strain ATCC 74030 / MF5533) TaxID=1104152 RepID=H0EVM0_GLAL7|nr:hypothetical protein M7I_6819 [Glarea lozoyensis 74030]
MSPQPTSHLPSIDPSAPGTIIRTALLFESVTTIGAGLYFLLLPHRYLLTTMGASTTQTTTTAVQMTQQFGAANILVGTVVGLFVSNSRKSIEARQTLR